ncbi:MAG: hypothetical protein HZB91_08650 [Elusimicrobia bacterium]|nr:hypothetical protein [Elusimicrobiota bacterium]
MRFDYAKSFHATIGSLSRGQALRLYGAVAKFEAAWEAGRFHRGLRMKHLRDQFFEFRVDIHDRVLYLRREGTIRYLLYGSHDDIRRFLKSQ